MEQLQVENKLVSQKVTDLEVIIQLLKESLSAKCLESQRKDKIIQKHIDEKKVLQNALFRLKDTVTKEQQYKKHIFLKNFTMIHFVNFVKSKISILSTSIYFSIKLYYDIN